MKRILSSGIALLIITAWLLSPVAVFAQDEIPPVEETPTEVVPSEVNPTPEPDVTVEEVVEALPEDTTLVVLDESNSPLDLASPEAEEMLGEGDPIFCPCGVPPIPNTGGCSARFDWIYQALNAAMAYAGTCGQIYVIDSFVANNNNVLTINGSLFTAGFFLEIIGGWDGVYGGTATTSTLSVLNRPLEVLNFNTGVTSGFSLYNFIINPADVSNFSALTITDSTNITLNNLEITDTTDLSAVVITNTDHILINDTLINESGSESAIYLDNSDYFSIDDSLIDEKDYGAGIYVYESDYATIDDMEISEDYYGHGIYLNNSSYATISDSFVGESGYGHGVYMYYAGDSLLEDVTIIENEDGNGLYGSYSHNNIIDALTVFEHSSGNGMYLDNTINNDFTNTYVAEDGNGNGIYMDLADGTSFDGLTVYEEGDGNGIKLYDTFGNTFENLTIEAYDYGNAFRADEANGLIVDGAQVRSYDFGNGFNIWDTHDVTLLNVISNGNYGNGAHFGGNYGNLVIENSTFNENGYGFDSGAAFLFESSYVPCGSGIMIEDHDGSVYITNVTTNDNAVHGVYVEVYGGVQSGVGVGLLSFEPQPFPPLTILVLNEVFVDHLTSIGNEGTGLYIQDAGSGEVNSLFSINGFEPLPFGLDAYVSYSTIQDNGEDGIGFYSFGTLYTCDNVVSGNGTSGGPWWMDVYFNGGTWIELCTKQGEVAEQLPPIVVPVKFETERGLSIGAAFAADRGMVFLLQREEADGSKTLMGQASLPGGSVPVGTLVTMTEVVEATLPAALPEGTSYVGPAFTMAATGTDGIALKYLNGTMEVKFLLPDGLTIPEGQRLAIQMYQDGLWTTLPTFFGEKFATAYTGSLGTFVLSLVPVK